MMRCIVLLLALLAAFVSGQQDCAPPPAQQIELVLLLDASWSLDEDGWAKSVLGARSLVDALLTSEAVDHRISVVYFHRDAVDVSLRSGDAAQVKSALSSLRLPEIRAYGGDGGEFYATDHPDALGRAEEIMALDRDNRRKVAVLLTDGEPYRASSSCREGGVAGAPEAFELPCSVGNACYADGCLYDCLCTVFRAEEFRSKGHELYVMGVPNSLHEGNFDAILTAMASPGRYSRVENFNAIAAAVDATAVEVCTVESSPSPTRFPVVAMTAFPSAYPTSSAGARVKVVVPAQGASEWYTVDLKDETLGDMQARISADFGMRASDQVITHLDGGSTVLVVVDATLWALGVRNEHTLVLEQLQPTAAPTQEMVFVVGPAGRTASFVLDLGSETLARFQMRIAEEFGVPVSEQTLLHSDRGNVLLDGTDSSTLAAQYVRHLDTIVMRTAPPTKSPTASYVTVDCLAAQNFGEETTLTVDLATNTVASLQASISILCGVSAEDQVLFHLEANEELRCLRLDICNVVTLAESGIEHQDTIQLRTSSPSASPTLNHCFNGRADGSETDADCGGGECVKVSFERTVTELVVDLDVDSVRDVMIRISEIYSIEVQDQRIAHLEQSNSAWHDSNPGLTLAQTGIGDLDTLIVTLNTNAPTQPFRPPSVESSNDCAPPPAQQIELVLLLDASWSLDEDGWAKSVLGARSLVDALLTSEAVDHRISVVYFHRDAVDVSLRSGDAAQVKSALSSLRLPEIRAYGGDGGEFYATDHPDALGRAEEIMALDRDNRRKVAVLLTDGEPYRASSSCREGGVAGAPEAFELPCSVGNACYADGCLYDCLCTVFRAEEFRSKGHELYVMGVPNSLHEGNFDAILTAMASPGRYSRVENFNAIAAAVDATAVEVCTVESSPTFFPTNVPEATGFPSAYPTRFPVRSPTPRPSTRSPTEMACYNKRQDYPETDVDCGGGECPRCRISERCIDGQRDCETEAEGVCVLPTEAPTSQRIKVIVPWLPRGSTYRWYDVNLRSDSVRDIMLRIEQDFGLPLSAQTIQHLESSKYLFSEFAILQSAGVENHDTLLLERRDPTPAPTSTRVKVISPSGNPVYFDVNLDVDTVESIKDRIFATFGIPPDMQHITHVDQDNRPFDDGDENDTLRRRQVQHLDTLVLYTLSPTQSPSVEFITILCPNGGRHMLNTDLDDDTFELIRQRIQDLCGVPPEEQELVHPRAGTLGEPIYPPDLDTPSDEGIESGDLLVVTTVPPTQRPSTAQPTLDLCSNEKRDGSETDIDCGGYSCPKCEIGQKCYSGIRDCLSSQCGDVVGVMRCIASTEPPTAFPTPKRERIKVFHWDGRFKDFDVRLNTDTVSDILRRIIEEFFIDRDDFTVTHLEAGDIPFVGDYETLAEMEVANLDALRLWPRTSAPANLLERIKVIGPDGVSLVYLDVDIDRDTVEKVQDMIEEAFGISPAKQKITHLEARNAPYEGRDETLRDKGVVHLDTLVLHTQPPTSAPVQPVLKVVCLGGELRSFDVDLEADTIDDVKDRVALECGVAPEEQVIKHLEGSDGGALMCERWRYCDVATPSEEGMVSGDTLILHTASPTSVPTTPFPTVAKCDNMKLDGFETDVDCGGGDCPPCATGLNCVEGYGLRDCVSEFCHEVLGGSGVFVCSETTGKPTQSPFRLTTIRVKHWDTDAWPGLWELNVDLEEDTVQDVKLKISEHFEIPFPTLTITHLEQGNVPFDGSSEPLLRTGIKHRDTLMLWPQTLSPSVSQRIKVIGLDGRLEYIDVVLKSDTVEGIMERIENIFDVPVDEQLIDHIEAHPDIPDVEFHDESNKGLTLSNMGVANLDALRLHSLSPTAAPSDSQIKVRCTDGTVHYIVVALDYDTIFDVKRRVEQRCSVPTHDQLLLHVGDDEDGMKPLDCATAGNPGERSSSDVPNEDPCMDTILSMEGIEHMDTLVLMTVAPSAAPTTFTPTMEGCADGERNGAETDLDCGGGSCAKCTDGLKCVYGERDCRSGLCDYVPGAGSVLRCVPATNKPSISPTPIFEQIYVQHWDGRIAVFHVNLDNDSVSKIKLRIVDEFGVPFDQQVITHLERNDALFDGIAETLDELFVRNGDTLQLHEKTESPTVAEQVKVYCHNATMIRVAVVLNVDTVDDIKDKIEKVCGVSAEEQLITHLENNNRPFHPHYGDETLSEVGISNLDSLLLFSQAPTSSPTTQKLRIRCTDGELHVIEVELEIDTMSQIKEEVEGLCGVRPDDQQLLHIGQDPNNNGAGPLMCDEASSGLDCDIATPVDEGIEHMDTLLLTTFAPTPSPTAEAVYVRCNNDAAPVLIYLELEGESMTEVKEKIYLLCGVPVPEQRIYHDEGFDPSEHSGDDEAKTDHDDICDVRGGAHTPHCDDVSPAEMGIIHLDTLILGDTNAPSITPTSEPKALIYVEGVADSGEEGQVCAEQSLQCARRVPHHRLLKNDTAQI